MRWSLFGLALLMGCPTTSSEERLVCQRFGEARVVGYISNPQIAESSGLAVSSFEEGGLWTHNDSGGDAALYAMSKEGEDLGVVELGGATANDWEALGAGPCAEGSCLWVGDIGDNGTQRGSVTIWRVVEPEPPGKGRVLRVDGEARTASYPGGARDAEALAVDPRTGDLLVVEKVLSAEPRSYRLEHEVWERPAEVDTRFVELEQMDLQTDSLTGGMVTGAGFSPGGRNIFLRTYIGGFLLAVDRDLEGRVKGFSAPQAMPVFSKGQCESVAYSPDGAQLWFTCEGVNGVVAKSDCEEWGRVFDGTS